MTSRIAALCCTASLMVFAWVGPVAAGAPGTLQGRVVDDQGNHLAGVEVEILSESTSAPLTATTKKKGTFAVRIPDRGAVYEVRCRRDGFLEAAVLTRPSQREVTFVEVTMVRRSAPQPSAAPRPADSSPAPPAARADDTNLRSSAIGVFNEGVAALQAKDTDTAVARFRESAAIDPEFPEPYRALAAIAMDREDFAAAADAAERLLQLTPDDVEAMRTVYFASVMLGDAEGIGIWARKLLAADPTSAEGELMEHARGLFDEDLLGPSRALLEALTEQRPELAEAHFLLGLCCNSLGDAQRAGEELRTFLELAPDHADADAARSLLEYLQ
jgi:Tfp pilus assembly protein PilF